jgi:hypothetical protein
MKTNADKLAEEYALVDQKFLGNTGQYYTDCVKDFKAGFNKCLELVRPILSGTSSALDLTEHKNFIANVHIKEFLEKYKL